MYYVLKLFNIKGATVENCSSDYAVVRRSRDANRDIDSSFFHLITNSVNELVVRHLTIQAFS